MVFLMNDASAMTRVLPVACGGVDQLSRSFPAEFPVSVNFDEIIQSWETCEDSDHGSESCGPRCSGERYL